MKALLFLVALVLLTQNAWSHPQRRIAGLVNWGPFVNCELYNDGIKTLNISKTHYTVMYNTGQIRTHTYLCTYGCKVKPFETKRFSGPVNSGLVMSATCSFETKKGHHRHPRHPIN